METDMERLITRVMKGVALLLFAFLSPFSCFAYYPLFPLTFSLLLLLFSSSLTLSFFFSQYPKHHSAFNVIE